MAGATIPVQPGKGTLKMQVPFLSTEKALVPVQPGNEKTTASETTKEEAPHCGTSSLPKRSQLLLCIARGFRNDLYLDGCIGLVAGFHSDRELADGFDRFGENDSLLVHCDSGFR